MEFHQFLLVFSAAILGSWLIQGISIGAAMVALRVPGAGLAKTAKISSVLVLVSLAVKSLGLIAAGTAPQDSATQFAVILVSLGFSFYIVKRLGGMGFGKTAIVVVVVAITGGFCSLAVKSTIAQAFRCPTGGMMPEFAIGDHFYASRYSFRSAGPSRGDVVVFATPNSPDVDTFRRVVGLPGETVEVRDRVVLIDNVPIDDPWGYYDETSPGLDPASPRVRYGPVVVPQGEYFMLGDNRYNSVDSRMYGAVSGGALIGKVMLRYWPAGRISRLAQ